MEKIVGYIVIGVIGFIVFEAVLGGPIANIIRELRRK